MKNCLIQPPIKKVLVTGGAGFIGSHLVQTLLERGFGVRVFDNFATGKRENLHAVAATIDLHEGDLRDRQACQAACHGVSTVFHLGALGSVPRSISDPLTTNAVNVEGTLNLLLAAQEANVGRFVFSSSSSVYGDTPTLPKHEAMPLSPRSPYAVSKMAGEAYCRAFYHTYGLQTVVLRYFNVFGPRQDPQSAYAAVLPRFLSALSNGTAPEIYGDGLQSRDFTYVANVVEANLLAAVAVPEAAGQVFNIACGEQFTVQDILSESAKLLGRNYVPLFKPDRPGDVRHSRADISAACQKLGYHPVIYFQEGLARTVRAYTS